MFTSAFNISSLNRWRKAFSETKKALKYSSSGEMPIFGQQCLLIVILIFKTNLRLWIIGKIFEITGSFYDLILWRNRSSSKIAIKVALAPEFLFSPSSHLFTHSGIFVVISPNNNYLVLSARKTSCWRQGVLWQLSATATRRRKI